MRRRFEGFLRVRCCPALSGGRGESGGVASAGPGPVRVECAEGDRGLDDVRLARCAQVVAGDVGDPAQTVADGVGVHEERSRARLDAAAAAGRRSRSPGGSRPPWPEGGGRALYASRGGVTGEDALGQEFVGQDGPRRMGPRRGRAQSAEGGAGGAAGGEEARHGRPDDDRAVGEEGDDRRHAVLAGFPTPPRMTTRRRPCTAMRLSRRIRAAAARMRSTRVGRGGGAAADHDDDRSKLAPAQCRCPRDHLVVVLAAEHGVDDE